MYASPFIKPTKHQTLFGDEQVIKFNAQLDHIHLVIVIPPRVSVASVVEYMKSQTRKKLKEKFEFMRKAIYRRSGIWWRGYCVSSIGMDERTILAYIELPEMSNTWSILRGNGGILL